MKLKLLKPHRHDGIDYAAGQTLTLDPELVDTQFLVDFLTTGKKPIAELLPDQPAQPPVETAPEANQA